VVTGAPLHIAEMEIDIVGKQNFGVGVVANFMNNIKPKPHPHGIEECMSLLGVEKGETLFIGNGEEDVLAAKAAGVKDIIVDRKEHELIETEPSHVIQNLTELKNLIN
jgi:phosphoglycolate phosphatase-like HAD superfamily hydrolase